jgi:dTDP-4-amino-4,6-dideoxygalactose transaminase
MNRIDTYLRKREKIWEQYNEAFSDLPVICPIESEKDTVHARHLYTLLLDIDRITKSRNEVQQELHDLNIGTGIHFMSLHLHDYYRKTYGFEPEDFPNAKFISERTISLPLSPKLNEKDVEDVTAAVKHVFS